MNHLCIGVHVGDIETNRALHAIEVIVQTRILINEQGSGYTAQVQRITQIHLEITLDEFDSSLHFIHRKRRLVAFGNVDFAHT